MKNSIHFNLAPKVPIKAIKMIMEKTVGEFKICLLH
jgi:hypothetical protein